MVETAASARSSFLILKMFIMLRIFYALSIFAFVSPEGFSYLKYEYSLLERNFRLKKRFISDRIWKGISPQRSFLNTL